LTGNINDDPDGAIDIGDLTYLIVYLYAGGQEPPCMDAANVDGIGDVDIGDITRLIKYMFIDYILPVPCGTNADFGTVIDSMENVYQGSLGLRVPVDETITLYLRYINASTDQYVIGFQNAFRIYSTDGVEWGGVSCDSLVPGWQERFEVINTIRYYGVDGVDSDTIQMAALTFQSSDPAHSLEPGFNEYAYSITIGPFRSEDHNRKFILDTCRQEASGSSLFGTMPGGAVVPLWNGPFEFRVDAHMNTATAEPAAIVVRRLEELIQ
jgi:hypothetical protein